MIYPALFWTAVSLLAFAVAFGLMLWAFAESDADYPDSDRRQP
jgi:hypothetical protein